MLAVPQGNGGCVGGVVALRPCSRFGEPRSFLELRPEGRVDVAQIFVLEWAWLIAISGLKGRYDVWVSVVLP